MSRIVFGGGPSAAATPSAWEYQARDDGRWVNFHTAHATTINRAVAEGVGSVTLELNKTPYVLDLATSTMAAFGSDFNFQKNALAVRRVPNM